MKNKFLAVALLSTTFLTFPAKAEAGPVGAFLLSAVVPSSGLLAAGGALAGYSGAIAFGGTFLGTALGNIAVSLGVNAILTALNPVKSASTSGDVSRLINFKQPVTYMSQVYGKTRVGGPYGFTGFGNDKRYYNIILAAHEIESIQQHYLDERQVSTDGSDIVTTAPIGSYGKISEFLGGSGQVAPADLVSAFTEITSDYNFKGLAHSVITASRPPQDKFSDVYPRSREWQYTAVVEGKNDIYDPRDTSYGYTNNAALILADWLVNTVGVSVDWTEVAAEATAADVLVTNKEATTQAKWMLNGSLNDGQSYEQQRALLAISCDTFMYERTDGKVGFKLGRWEEPTVTLTDEDFLSLSYSLGNSGTNTPTEVSVIYTEPEIDYQEQVSSPYVISSSGVKRQDQPNLPFVTTHNQAARLNKRLAKLQNPVSSISGTVNMIGYELLGERFIKVEHTGLGVDKYYEIQELNRTESLGVFTFSATETQSSDFDFTASSEEGDKPVREVVVSDNTVPVPSNVSATDTGNGTITVTFDDPGDAYTVRVEASISSNVVAWNVGTTNQTSLVLSGLTPGQTYDIQARTVTAAQRKSALEPSTPIQVYVNDPNDPGALSNVSATVGMGHIVFSFDTPNDPNYRGVRVYRGATDLASATEVLPLTETLPNVTTTVTAGDDTAVNVISNGDFATDTLWTKGSNWSIGSGRASHASGSFGILSQSFTALEVGEDYRAAYTIYDDDHTDGNNIRFRVTDGTTHLDPMSPVISAPDVTASAYYDSSTFTAVGVLDEVHIRPATNFGGDVDDLYLFKETSGMLDQGESKYWVVPVSYGLEEGTESGPFTIHVP